jgi:beta-galactosidase
LTRRTFLHTAAVATVGLRANLGHASGFNPSNDRYTPPVSPRQKLNFNIGWRFLREDTANAELPVFDDSKWAMVSTPHTWDDVDSFRQLISHSGGDRGTYKGIGWYRKHFKLPSELSSDLIFLEFEGMRQAGDIFLNGKSIGLYENGVTAYGVDISKLVNFGDKENVLAVKVDNSTRYEEHTTDTTFEWNANDFNPSFGGINRHVWLHVTSKIYQTLPLYYGLETEGVYIHADHFNISARTADITVESQIKNASGDRVTVGLSIVIVDAAGQISAQFDADPVDMVDGEKDIIVGTGSLKNARFWCPEDPYLYEVFTICTVNGKVVDVQRETTGFRKAEFRGGVGKGGLYLNDKFVYLKGFAQRSTNEWAGLGQAYPDWMHDYTAQMMHACYGNYVRWMHVSPQKIDADALTRYGIVQVCPAGDKERDAVGHQWDQRVDVMRDTIIYFRNNPGILFWEAGNTVITPEHMEQMVALRKQYDPSGGRAIGTRGNDDDSANNAITSIAEYFGVMIGQDPKTDLAAASGTTFRAYSNARRDRAPIIETEDFRDEGARRYWDDYSPPYFGFKKGANDTYEYTSESFALAGIQRYWEYYANRISNTDPIHSKWAGYASIYFSDSDADGRQDSSEVARVSGKVDAVRLPKEIYYASRVMQADRPDIHILGHWTYPRNKNVVKTIYVVCNVESVELFVNGNSVGVSRKRESGYVFAFPKIEFAPGSIKAVGSLQGKPVIDQQITTAGPAVAIKLTPILGPRGLQADGADVALVDVEVVDAKGQRCPTDDARIDFTCSGPAVWRGGYNSGKLDSTNNLYLNTEDGINRVSLRSGFEAGVIVLSAKRKGLKPAEIRIIANEVKVREGLSTTMPFRIAIPFTA